MCPSSLTPCAHFAGMVVGGWWCPFALFAHFALWEQDGGPAAIVSGSGVWQWLLNLFPASCGGGEA